MKNITTFTPQKLVSLASQLIYGDAYPNPDDPQPPGPWGPIIRQALESMVAFGPGVQPWRMIARRRPEVWDIFGGGPFSHVALNPQPLPPGIVFVHSLASAVIDRVLLIHDVAAAVQPNDSQQSDDFVTHYLNRFVDDLCPNPPKIKKPKGPYPPDPDPHPEWSAIELAVVALEFQQVAAATDNKNLQQIFLAAGEKLLETGMERL